MVPELSPEETRQLTLIELAETARQVADGVEGLPAQVAARLAVLERRARRSTAAMAVLALLLAAASAGFGLLNRRQDDARAAALQARDRQIVRLDQQMTATQQVNVLFRERVCATLGDWRVYLQDAPAGPPAGQAAAGRLVASLSTLCPE